MSLELGYPFHVALVDRVTDVERVRTIVTDADVLLERPVQRVGVVGLVLQFGYPWVPAPSKTSASSSQSSSNSLAVCSAFVNRPRSSCDSVPANTTIAALTMWTSSF